ncbi:mannose-ethanolamine phosphotransferase gpi13 [Stygiomarasmius scandens]|uniref:Mannose-ethanolamine phosphotransferase gpi13 n=1 Tax=Marasmiellus scandens TaxID=2682957 RepID=A0ABR1K9Z7_9AGAR
MRAKLEQMNQVLTRVVELLDDDTLLVVLGDHGMDRSGDHGGDDIFETSSAMWIYSKGPDLAHTRSTIPSGLLQYTTFPGAKHPHRSVQQIDILPTISLLLGLPIPFNNLGRVIPELFWRDAQGSNLLHALELNAEQIRKYLLAYRSSSSGGELDNAWQGLESAWTATRSASLNTEQKLITLSNFTRVALSACRAIWAQFNPLLMALGLVLLAVGMLASWALYSGLSAVDYRWNDWLEHKLWRCLRGIAGGAALGFLLFLGLEQYLPGMDALDCVIFAAPFTSCLVILFSTPPTFSVSGVPFLLILHSLSFLSNSFTFWEDRIMTFLTVSSILPFVITGFTAPTGRLRRRILLFSLGFIACVRLMAISTICREEQQPYCHVTFYSSSSIPVAPKAILTLILPVTLAIPVLFRMFLSISKSHVGLANIFLPTILTPSLLFGATFWTLEWMDATEYLGNEWSSTLRFSRTWLARFCFITAVVIGGTLWYTVPLCIRIERGTDEKTARQVKVIGFANAFGSPYLLFWSIFLCIVFIANQLTGQVVLGLFTLALLCYLEVVDSARDVRMLETTFASKPSLLLDANTQDDSPPIRFNEVVPLALLGLHAFYTTGHQSVISSIQWKSAFLLTPKVTYPFSPLTVVLNSFGSLFLVGLAVPLLALWNRSPKAAPANPRASPDSTEQVSLDVQVKGESVLAALGMMSYYASLLLGTAVSAAILRRHLMVWKVFAPRFMAGALGLIVIDVAAILGVSLGVGRISKKVNEVFNGAFRSSGTNR